MPLIDKNNINKYKSADIEPVVHDSEPDDSSLTWLSYASLGPQDYLYSASEGNKPHKKYDYSSSIWYNERKGGKKRKSRRF